MKRAPDADAPAPAKRRRASPKRGDDLSSDATFSDTSYESSGEDILRDGLRPDRYVSGTVHMRWPPVGNRMMLILKTSTGLKVGITFTGKCAPYFASLACDFRDQVKIRSHGAAITQTEQNVSLSLLYERGASLMFVKTRNNARDGQVVDTWSLDKDFVQPSQVNGDDWYSTPRPGLQPTDIVGHNDAMNAEAIIPRKGANDDTVAPSREVVTSRLAASTSGFSPSVQLAATRRSTSTVKPVQPSANAKVEVDARSAADKSSSRSDGATAVTSGALPSKDSPRPEAGTAQPPPTGNVPRPDKLASKVASRDAFNGPSRPAENQSHQKDNATAPFSKKAEKARLRKLKKQSRASGQEQPQAQSERSSPSSTTRPSHGSSGSAPPQIDIAQAQPVEPTGERQAIPMKATETKRPVREGKPRSTSTMPEPSVLNRAGTAALQEAAITRGPSEQGPSTPKSKPLELSPRSVPSVASTRVTPKRETADASPLYRVGFRSEYAYYTPLAKVESRGKMYNIAAVVTSAGLISQTYTGESKAALSLTDPSVHEINDFPVNLFAKGADQLPEPARGDILLMRGILGDYYGRKCGTAPSYKAWSWAIVDPRARESIRKKGDINFQPTPSELQHCAGLGEWWTSVAPVQDLGVIHQIRPIRTGRIHRLISEASPTCEPDGYFDCTVEVLYGHANNNGIYSLYVTDYTQNPAMVPLERDWCPPMLSDKVLKMELFLEAAIKGPELKAGGYYFIGNCRMKTSTGGQLEATFSQVNKMRKLDDDALEDEPRLAALLQRKAEWQAKVEANGGAHEFPHLLFEETEENKHFRCTAEVLFVSTKDTSCYLYVTDYTRREDLAPVAPTVPRALQLKDRIVKIALHDDQAETGKQLEAGDFVAIRNLRLRPTGSEKKLTGRLGGSQRLLSKLQVNSPNDHELKVLVMRKEEFESKKNATHAAKGGPEGSKRKKKANSIPEKPIAPETGGTTVSPPPARPADASCPAPTELVENSSIKAVKEKTICPNKFRVRARIVDFYPPEISKFTTRKCTQCQDERSSTQRVCPVCDDAMDPDNKTSVRSYWYFALEVQDEEEERLQIFSCDDQCSILKGLDPADLEGDDRTVQELADRLRPLCGGLLEIRAGVPQRRAQELPFESPWLSLVLGSYASGDEDDPSARQYILLECTVAA
ncbi:uncharacterized protein C8Q71DRAFT_237564 [Rhodofomes roseus]|uniref:Protection of telomeres protein 1 n=1 Tax=Rhodofomes roseus TaxID=34475 RepID=A0ABQ8KXR5_9APHY|nr:uncharacterized protein C8Q71DRAFT_237564 [Rhodofomes roseus]KAH9843158.1 hypothetical protein C8Q71DRAFT_237564 [Rhodofomes roseus]